MQIIKNKDGSTTRRDDCPIHTEPLPVQPESAGLAEKFNNLRAASCDLMGSARFNIDRSCFEVPVKQMDNFESTVRKLQ